MNQEQVGVQEAEARRPKHLAAGGKKNRRKIVNSQSSETQRELYYPDLYEYKKLDLTIQKKRVVRGSWSLQENKIYLNFLSRFRKDFITEEIRRKTVVFNRLSKELHKRTPDQCRSHHQKLQNRFNNDIDLIINFVEAKIKRKDMNFQAEQAGKQEKEMQGTRTSQNAEAEEGIVINMDFLMIW